MEKLFELQERHKKGELSSDETLKLVFDLYCVSESTLAKYGLTVKHFAYDTYQLRQNGEYLTEGERTECLERAKEIMDSMH